MPKRRYEQREPTHDWQQIRPFLKDSAQITYEVIRPCILGWETPKERAAETGMPMSSIYYKANLFDQAGMASLLPPAPPPEIPKQDKRSLPPHIRQEIVDLYAQYLAFRPHEIATICFVKFNRKPAPATIKLILASGPKPSTTERRHPRYAEIESGKERRRLVIRLHVDGWNAKSIAGYLDVSRKTVHEILQRFAEEQFAGLEDTSHARKKLRKVDIQTIQEMKKLSENPLLGAYRVSAALEQMGIKLSRASLRPLSFHQSGIVSSPDAAQAAPKGSYAIQSRAASSNMERGHSLPGYAQFTGNRNGVLHLDSRKFFARHFVLSYLCTSGYRSLFRCLLCCGSPVRCSRACWSRIMAASFFPPTPGGDVRSSASRKRRSKKENPIKITEKQRLACRDVWPTGAKIRRRRGKTRFSAHDTWMRDYNFQKHMAHEERQDGCHSPAEVLGWVKGMQPEEAVVHQAFSAICETRRLDKAGYAKFRNWSLYGERGLAGEVALVNIFQDFLTLEYEQEKLSRYSVEWQPDDRHLARVGNPRFYRHPYQSPQQELWGPGEVEWFVIIRNAPPVRRRRRKSRLVVMQLPLLADGTQG